MCLKSLFIINISGSSRSHNETFSLQKFLHDQRNIYLGQDYCWRDLPVQWLNSDTMLLIFTFQTEMRTQIKWPNFSEIISLVFEFKLFCDFKTQYCVLCRCSWLILNLMASEEQEISMMLGVMWSHVRRDSCDNFDLPDNKENKQQVQLFAAP